MKQKPYTKLVVAAFMTAFLTLVVFIACNKNKTDKKEVFHLPDEISNPGLISRHPDLPILSKKMTGSVTIYHFSSGEILVTIKDKNKTEVLNKFIIQTKETGSNSTELRKINNAELIYLFDVILLNDLDKNQLIAYTVNSSTLNETYNYIPLSIKSNINNTITGYGLGYSKGEWERLNENISLNNSIHALRHGQQIQTELDDGGGNGVSCKSGGTGSSSCSISGCFNQSCSVSCSAGYYACCYCDDVLPDLGPSCLCKPVPGGGN